MESGAPYNGTCKGTYSGTTSDGAFTIAGTYQFDFTEGSPTVSGILTVTNCNPNPGPFNVTGLRVSGTTSGVKQAKGTGPSNQQFGTRTCNIEISLARTANTTQPGTGIVICNYQELLSYNVTSICTSA